jgi:hypothetical protein
VIQVRVVAVSKTKPVSVLKQAYDAGHRQFGENYAQVQLCGSLDASGMQVCAFKAQVIWEGRLFESSA